MSDYFGGAIKVRGADSAPHLHLSEADKCPPKLNKRRRAEVLTRHRTPKRTPIFHSMSDVWRRRRLLLIPIARCSCSFHWVGVLLASRTAGPGPLLRARQTVPLLYARDPNCGRKEGVATRASPTHQAIGIIRIVDRPRLHLAVSMQLKSSWLATCDPKGGRRFPYRRQEIPGRAQASVRRPTPTQLHRLA